MSLLGKITHKKLEEQAQSRRPFKQKFKYSCTLKDRITIKGPCHEIILCPIPAFSTLFKKSSIWKIVSTDILEERIKNLR